MAGSDPPSRSGVTYRVALTVRRFISAPSVPFVPGRRAPGLDSVWGLIYHEPGRPGRPSPSKSHALRSGPTRRRKPSLLRRRRPLILPRRFLLTGRELCHYSLAVLPFGTVEHPSSASVLTRATGGVIFARLT